MRKTRDLKKKRKSKIKIIVNIILITLFTLLLMNTVWGIYKENNIKKVEENININYQEVSEVQKEESKKIQQVSKKEIVDKEYKGYAVIAKLEIPQINLITNVLSEYTKEALDVCVTKFWGPNPNEIGNFCIAGHNMKQENMFYNLEQLEIGDRLILLDNEYGKIEYEIYDIYKVKPENTDSLSQDTNGKREITLITCTNYSNHRIIIKAKECI